MGSQQEEKGPATHPKTRFLQAGGEYIEYKYRRDDDGKTQVDEAKVNSMIAERLQVRPRPRD